MAHDQFYDEPSGEYQTYKTYGVKLGKKVGLDKPNVIIVQEAPDKYMWLRQKAANDLKVDVKTLPDEPDEMSDHSDQQDYGAWED